MSGEKSEQKNFIPIWMDQNFFETALQSSENDRALAVKSFNIESATAPGDNYFSEMFRATVQILRDAKLEERSLIVKAAPRGKVVKKFVTESKIFQQEATMLRDVIPEMNRLLEEILPGVYQPIAAKHIYSCHGPHMSVVVLEDLKKLGFKMDKINSGLDLDRCLLVMRHLARFHAASVALRKRNPELLEPFVEAKVLKAITENWGGALKSTFEIVAKEIEKWPECGKRYSNKILNLSVDAAERYSRERTKNDADFNVLIHGDLWANNMMFKYSEDDDFVMGTRFVDYQMCYWASPTIDLHYFFISSACDDILDKTDTLIVEYYRTLEETLTLLGCKDSLPSWREFMTQFNTRGAYAVICALTIRRAALADPNKVTDMDKLLKNEQEFHCSDLYMESLKIVLPILERKGWF